MLAVRLILLICLPVIFLSACGFHLKGIHKPRSVLVYPTYQNIDAPFKLVFQQALRENNMLAADASQAKIKITFIKENWQRRALSVTSTGIPAEYRLSYTLFYQLDENGSKKKHEMTENKAFTSDNSELLAVESKQARIKQQIREQLAARIINVTTSGHF